MLSQIISQLDPDAYLYVNETLTKIPAIGLDFLRGSKNPTVPQYRSESSGINLHFDNVSVKDLGDVAIVVSWVQEVLHLIKFFVSGLVKYDFFLSLKDEKIQRMNNIFKVLSADFSTVKKQE